MLLDIITIFLFGIGVLFMLIAAIGILRLPDFYLRMSAITKAATLGLGMILLGVAIHFDDIGVFFKTFVIISFLLLTSPVGAHAIARAAYRQGVQFWGRSIVDQLANLSEKVKQLETEWAKDYTKVYVGEELIYTLMQLPSSHGGSFTHAISIANTIKVTSPAKGNRLLGIINSKMGRSNLAEQHLLKACTLSSYADKSVLAISNFYIDQKLPNKAINLLEKALNAHPENVMYLSKVIYLSSEFGVKYKLGLDCCNRIINLETEVAPDDLLRAARYKRYFIERLSGRLD